VTRCWFCAGTDDLIDFAYVEDATRPVIEAHPDCVKRFGFAEAMTPAKVEP
jgi:hypothetical protein